MSRFREAGSLARAKLLSAAQWVWLNTTDAGQATQAFMRGDAAFDRRLRIDDGSHLRKVSAIEDIGWKLSERVDLTPVQVETTTARDDGTREVTRETKQEGDFYFVRIDEPATD